MTRLYWVAYDIGDDRERRRVERCLARRGQRLQKSLFACVLDEARLRALQADLQALPLRTGQVVLAGLATVPVLAAGAQPGPTAEGWAFVPGLNRAEAGPGAAA
jgi:hypothetical protein